MEKAKKPAKTLFIYIAVAVIIIASMLIWALTIKSKTMDTFTTSDTLPLEMDFKDFQVRLNDYTITEFEDSKGYTSVIDFQLEFNDSTSQRDVGWILKDDLNCSIYIKDEDEKIDLSTTSELENLIEPKYVVFDNIAYYDIRMQTQDRYSVEDAELLLVFDYYIEDKPLTFYSYKAIITADKMMKIKESGDITTGESAQGYFDNKIDILN